ncbi:phox domain-containing protein isoform X2 [Wolffia australiana]
MVELVGNHLDLYRRNQSEIGIDIIGTLSFEERDEKLKQHLMSAKELHPALISPESEYKVLQRLVGGILATVLRPQEAHCPLVRCLFRELLTCLVMQPVMNLASPGFINELIEDLFLSQKNNVNEDISGSKALIPLMEIQGANINIDPAARGNDSLDSSLVKPVKMTSTISERPLPISSNQNPGQKDLESADWARVLDAATQRRTQVLAPENLENMWTRGRNYQKKSADIVKAVTSSTSLMTSSGSLLTAGSPSTDVPSQNIPKETVVRRQDIKSSSHRTNDTALARDLMREPSKVDKNYAWTDMTRQAGSVREQLKRSTSASALVDQSHTETKFIIEKPQITDSHGSCSEQCSSGKEGLSIKSRSEYLAHGESTTVAPKIRCRVIGACFEKISSKSFAVYSIAVADSENQIWIVKRRYRNFERLHRQLKDIPNYSLHLPPKRFLSSSIDDSFVHQRCILLDKYLQELLSIPNVAEQHEVWDFFSVASKNYSFGKSTSVMKTLAVNVDDAMDDIVRQFKGVSDGILRKVSGLPSPSMSFSVSPQKMEPPLTLAWNDDEQKHSLGDRSPEMNRSSNLDMSNSLSEEEVQDEEVSSLNGWHSDNELNAKAFPPRVVKRLNESGRLDARWESRSGKLEAPRVPSLDDSLATASSVVPDPVEDQNTVPPEWTPPNVSVPLLNLVDNIFQLNRRGWLRRQVFWISKQILQLMMEDAFDDWLLRKIHWLRQDETVAQGIDWVKNTLWPNGTFFTKVEGSSPDQTDIHSNQVSPSASRPPKLTSFELQLEAARRASNIKKMFLDGAPTALVSLIGYKQYRRCAKDVYYFLQSTVCVKQLAYGMLELLIISIFPELRRLVEGLHLQKTPQTEKDIVL